MLKGKSVIELTDVHTGKKKVHEDTNLVTDAVSAILNLYDNTSFDGQSGEKWMLPIVNKLTGGILLYQEPLEERVDNLYAPFSNPLIGYASSDANNTTDVRRGSRNLTESKRIDGGQYSLYSRQSEDGLDTFWEDVTACSLHFSHLWSSTTSRELCVQSVTRSCPAQ